MASRIGALLPNVKTGSLRFWGEWFGRPYDNRHRIVRCWDEKDSIMLEFDRGETLGIWQPQGLLVSADVFSIRSAVRVRWQWHDYGRPRLPQNLYFEEFVNEGSVIAATSNVDWPLSAFAPSIEENAVEIL